MLKKIETKLEQFMIFRDKISKDSKYKKDLETKE